MELLGHYISYLKEKNLKSEQVNLYVISNHYPYKLLKRYKELGLATVIVKGENNSVPDNQTDRKSCFSAIFRR